MEACRASGKVRKFPVPIGELGEGKVAARSRVPDTRGAGNVVARSAGNGTGAAPSVGDSIFCSAIDVLGRRFGESWCDWESRGRRTAIYKALHEPAHAYPIVPY
mmetsp:Transcript_113071/g.178669  ORF Transcript_113071/g.178669 Transcript_113071/m.178669 type:complete len:104 (-) Transcript_113071:31-342(-)